MPAERIAMRQVRDVLRLNAAGVSGNELARRVGVASSTIRLTLKRLAAAGLGWPLPAEMTDAALGAIAEFWRWPAGSGDGGLGLGGRRVGGDLDPVGESDTLNELGQLVVAIEPAPAFLGGIDQLEHHRAPSCSTGSP